MSKNHQKHKALVVEQLGYELRNTYHNATPKYPVAQNEYESVLFDEWFSDHAQWEIEYIQNGGANGHITRESLLKDTAALVQAGKSLAFASHLVNKRRKDSQEERSRCNRLDSRQHNINALWERISEYGELSTYGRGGRTLAPEDLVSGGSYNWHIHDAKDVTENMSYGDIVRLLMVLSSFNNYVETWNKDIPEQWKEAKDLNEWQKDIDEHEGLKPVRVTCWRKV